MGEGRGRLAAHAASRGEERGGPLTFVCGKRVVVRL